MKPERTKKEDYEGFFTPEDFGENGITKKELEEINNHPVGDLEDYTYRKRTKYPINNNNIVDKICKKKPKSDVEGQIVFG